MVCVFSSPSGLRRWFAVALLLTGWLLVFPVTGSRSRATAGELLGFRRGDCNADSNIDLSDPILILQHLFVGPPDPQCLDACDWNDDGAIDVNDAVLAFTRIFLGPLVFPEPQACGVDPTFDGLDCAVGFCSFGQVSEERSFTLETGRVGDSYFGDLPQNFQDEVSWNTGNGPTVLQPEIPFVEWGYALDNELPDGLVLDPATGQVSGSPNLAGVHTRDLWARRGDDTFVLYHVDIPVFTVDETEFANVPTGLEQNGPFLFNVLPTSFVYEHQQPWPPPHPLFNCMNTTAPPPTYLETKAVQVFYPSNLVGRLPILFFHHATGATSTDYTTLLSHLATHGVIGVSVNDQYSFYGYTNYYCWGGHVEAARVLLATRDHLRDLEDNPQSPLAGRIDWTRVFYGGHSRGGGAATVAAEFDKNTRGLFLLQGTDARQDSWIGNTSRWLTLPDVPVLSIAAEQDFDVIYPYAERLLERYRGPTTFVSIYGGCHGLTTDTNGVGCLFCDWSEVPTPVDRCRYIRRDAQQHWIKQLGAAFFRRYGFGDLSVETVLYGDHLQGSAELALAYRRNLSERILVDDFSAFPTNALGFTMLSSGMHNIAQGSCYDVPFPSPPGIVPAQNLVLDLAPQGIASLLSPLGTVAAPLDVSAKKRLTFRVKNHDVPGLADNFGFGWLDLALALQDADGNFAALAADSRLPQVEFHPDPEPTSIIVRAKYQRFVTVTILLDDFIAANPNLRLDRLVSLAWQWTTHGTVSVPPRVGLDDVQFE